MKPATPDIADVIAPFVFDHRLVFERLPLPELEVLLGQTTQVRYKKGEALFTQGSAARGAYWLRKGKVKIFQNDELGQRHILYLYTPGDLIGYRPLFSGEAHPVTAEAMEDAHLDFLSAEVFHGLVRESTFFTRNLLEILSREFSVWTNRITVFGVRPLRARLALILLILFEKYRTDSNAQTVITLSRTDLADFAGVKLETVVRMLNVFKTEGLVSVKGRRLFLADIPALIEVARGA